MGEGAGGAPEAGLAHDPEGVCVDHDSAAGEAGGAVDTADGVAGDAGDASGDLGVQDPDGFCVAHPSGIGDVGGMGVGAGGAPEAGFVHEPDGFCDAHASAAGGAGDAAVGSVLEEAVGVTEALDCAGEVVLSDGGFFLAAPAGGDEGEGEGSESLVEEVRGEVGFAVAGATLGLSAVLTEEEAGGGDERGKEEGGGDESFLFTEGKGLIGVWDAIRPGMLPLLECSPTAEAGSGGMTPVVGMAGTGALMGSSAGKCSLPEVAAAAAGVGCSIVANGSDGMTPVLGMALTGVLRGSNGGKCSLPVVPGEPSAA